MKIMTDLTKNPSIKTSKLILRNACYGRLYEKNMSAHARSLKYDTVICFHLEKLEDGIFEFHTEEGLHVFKLNGKHPDGYEWEIV